MFPITDTYNRYRIVVVKTGDSWQGTIYNPRGDLLTKTAFHTDSAGAFTEARNTIDIDISNRRRW